MSDPLFDSLLLLGSGGALVVAVFYGRWRSARWQASQYVAAALQFHRDLDPSDVAAFITSLAGLLPQRARRVFTTPVVIFETTADARGIAHRFLVAEPIQAFVLSQLRAALPAVRISDQAIGALSELTATELRLSAEQRSLRVDQPAAAAAAVLASLQPLGPDEAVVIQWLISPAGPVAPVKRSASSSSGPIAMVENLAAVIRDSEELQAARAKQASALFRGTLRLGVEATNPGRRRQLLSRLLGAWHVVNAPGVHLRQRILPARIVAGRMERRMPPVMIHPSLFNASELTALLGWPLGGPSVQGLWLGTARQLPVPPDVPEVGLILARSNFAGSERPIAVSINDSLKHLVVTGPTGSGKSTLLANLATQAMVAGQGLIVIEPHGSLVDDLLNCIPPHRVPDVIVLDPTDDQWPVGINPLAASHGDLELAVEQVVALFHQLYASSWGPRTDDVLRAALLTLSVATPQMTLAELPRLLLDDAFRGPLLTQVTDPVVRGFWAWFEQLSSAERANVVAPVTNKARAFLMRRRLRAIVGQADGIDLDQVLAERKILFVPLPTGTLGEDAAALLGSLVVALTWQAALRRAALPPSERFPVLLVIDELAKFLHLPTDVGDLLAEARKLGLALVLATQHLGQLPPPLRRGVLANARTKIAFAATADDAAILAREFQPHLTADDLRHLGPYEVALSIATGSTVAAPTTGVALQPSPPTNRGKAARAWSRQHFGTALADVEAAIEARQRPQEPSASVRRRRRGDA